MRKIFYTLGIIATSALAFSACQKEQEIKEEPQSGNLVTISFTAEKAGMETRTGIAEEGSSEVSYKWTDEDASNIKLFTVDGTTLTQVASPTITKVSDDKLTISATVAANATYTFRAILAGAWDGNTPKLSANQTPKSTSKFDPTADILISDDKAVTVGAEGASGDMLLTFRRQVVVNKMTLKNLPAGEKINSVAISSNKELASGSTSLTINYNEEVIPASGEFVVYFVTTPNTGVALTVAVTTTDKNTYSKSFAEGKSIDFNLGQFTKFGVAMPQNTPKYYVKVTSTANLLNGVYLIVYEDGNVAFNGGLETLDVASNTIDVSIDDNKIESNSTTDAAAFTISVDDGTILSKSGKYIGQTSDANGLSADITAFTNNVSVDENEATITSSGGAHLRYNSASNQNRFRYFKSSTYSAQNAIALYLLEGSGTAPSNETLTVTPASTNPETVSYEGGVMNYTVTTANIASWTATSDNEAFVVENVDGGFKVTVAANEANSPRTATITVTGGSKTATISITQEAAPAQIQTVTIAEFLSKEEGDALYQLTGTITSIANSNYGNLYIEDETGSVYVYGLKASATASSTSFNTLGLAVEDQVTIVGKRTVYNGTDEVTDCYYVSHIGAPSLTLSSESLAFASEGGSQNVTATVANFSGTVTISAESNNAQFSTSVSETTITVVASANSTNAVQTGVITVTATNGSKTKTATIDVSQNKPVQPAQDGDVLWAEAFNGFETNDVPSTSNSSTTVYGDGAVTYSCTYSGTKIYSANLAGGSSPELLISKDGGAFTVSGIPTGSATGMTLTFKSNKGCSVSSSTTGVTINDLGSYTYSIAVPSGTSTLSLTFSNTNTQDNTRVDDFSLIVGAPTPSISVTTGAASSTSTTDGSTAMLNGTISLENGANINSVSEAGFYYKLTNASSYSKVTCPSVTTLNFSYEVTGLTAASEYTYYAYAIYDNGAEVTGEPTTFTPTVSSGGGTYSMTPDQSSTGSSSTTYITTLTEFTYQGVSWKMNQWNPNSLQIKTNQSSAASEFRFYNTSAIPGRITKVVITFSALTVSDASKLMFLGGTSEVTATTGGTAGTWNSTDKTLTWEPGASDNFTYFAFYQNGKAASGTNKLASSHAIVVTYE